MRTHRARGNARARPFALRNVIFPRKAQPTPRRSDTDPHAESTRYQAHARYESSGVEVLVLYCTSVPVEDSDRRKGSRGSTVLNQNVTGRPMDRLSGMVSRLTQLHVPELAMLCWGVTAQIQSILLVFRLRCVSAFTDRAFHETTHRPNSWLPQTSEHADGAVFSCSIRSWCL